MTNKLNIYKRLKDVICITGRKRSTAAGCNAAGQQSGRLNFTKVQSFRLVSIVWFFRGLCFAYPRLCRFCPSDNFVRTRRATSLRLNYLNFLNLLNSEATKLLTF